MIGSKNIIKLGLLDSDAILPSGKKNTYYLYYKSDKDLYMYDSYRDIETNLFRLQCESKGKLEVYAKKILRGVLSLFAFKDVASKLIVTAYKLVDETSSASIIIAIKEEGGNGTGVLSVSASKALAVGNIEIRIRDEGSVSGSLVVEAYETPAKGTIEITVLSDEVSTGTLLVQAYKTLASGRIEIAVRSEEVGTSGSLSVQAIKDFARGDLQITVKNYETKFTGSLSITATKDFARGTVQITVKEK
jgi:hypothetical protein